MLRKGVRVFFLVGAVFTVFGPNAESREKKISENVGVGLSVGVPTGVNAKVWLSHENAVDATAGWGFWGTWLKADYLWHKWDFMKEDEDYSAPLYYGVGGFIGGLSDETGLGAEAVVGIDFLLKDSPVDFFAEIGPALQLAGGGGFLIHAALGARYYFSSSGSPVEK